MSNAFAGFLLCNSTSTIWGLQSNWGTGCYSMGQSVLQRLCSASAVAQL